ncbi:MAG: YggU family protein [Desulfuromonadaceae bacterium]|nr:YggU family protein [Desulfuromonadaceae bacterium]
MNGFLKPEKDGVSLHIRVQPRASRNEIIGPQGDELRIRLTSPPVEGAANQACREFFAALLGIAKNRITIAQGEKSRHKRLLIRTQDLDAIRGKLAEWLEG